MARHTENFEAVLFDLDGVLTSTAALHARCWKATFDELPLLEPFDIEHDYLAHVDGKPRYDGVRDFLASRGIALAEEQVRQIGDRKQALVERGLDGPALPRAGARPGDRGGHDAGRDRLQAGRRSRPPDLGG
jgi:beta-phosphoglucomutase-like phosphatase (HAD superfamily)